MDSNPIERAEAWLRCRPRFNSEPEDTTLIRDLLAVVSKLPRTADGEPITPGMKLHPWFCPSKHEIAGPVHTRYGYDVLYSTQQAAAERARAEQKGGGA